MSETMLKVDGINVYYGNIHALHDISFTVNKGEIVTLIGANGAGKSTNLKTISGLLRTKTGDIVFKDKSIKTMAPHKIVGQGLAHVPEGRRIFLRMTVQENLEKHIPSVLNRMFTAFLQLNAILKCLFLQR